MNFSQIVGQQHLKKHLTYSAQNGRIPHAQLFVGPEGSGTLEMAMAYAQYIICENIGHENTGGKVACNLKFKDYQHADLHFSFPYSGSDSKETNCNDFHDEWNTFIQQPYGSFSDWLKISQAANKQLAIKVGEANNIARKLSLKAYEGGYKVMIIWMADKMNINAANALLKLIEEPPQKTIFILITENEKDILPTIYSRCQVLHFNKLSETDIAQALITQHKMDATKAENIARMAQGNFNKALKLMTQEDYEFPFEEWFIQWIRFAFRANKEPQIVSQLISWSEKIAGIGRENQKLFIAYCLDFFRQALLINFKTPQLVYYENNVEGFDLNKFAPFVHGNNIHAIYEELNQAHYHIERNGNPKLIFTELSLNLTRLIHKK